MVVIVNIVCLYVFVIAVVFTHCQCRVISQNERSHIASSRKLLWFFGQTTHNESEVLLHKQSETPSPTPWILGETTKRHSEFLPEIKHSTFLPSTQWSWFWNFAGTTQSQGLSSQHSRTTSQRPLLSNFIDTSDTHNHSASQRSWFGSIRETVKKMWVPVKYIRVYQGTKWCRPSNNANNDTDYGVYEATDKCCQKHDRCTPVIGRQENEGWSPFYKFGCNCDKELYDCLKAVNDESSDVVGNTYFNIIGSTCLINRVSYPLVCPEYSWFGWCNRWEEDTSQPRNWTLVRSELEY